MIKETKKGNDFSHKQTSATFKTKEDDFFSKKTDVKTYILNYNKL